MENKSIVPKQIRNVEMWTQSRKKRLRLEDPRKAIK